MSNPTEATPATSNPNASTGVVREVAGTLREPIVYPIGTDGLGISYHWETDDGRHTYLYINLRKGPEDEFGLAHTNVDSEEVRGQGDALWAFLGGELQALSDRGGFPIVHRVEANPYSRRLPEADPRYTHISEGEFYGVYTPTPVDQDVASAQPIQVGHVALGANSVSDNIK